MRPDGRPGIALVNDTLMRGGAERVLLSLANGLHRERFRVHVVLTRRAGELAQDLAKDVALFSLDRHSRRDLGAVGRFLEFLARERIDLVHTHSHSAAYFARIARILSRGRWLHVMHDHYPLIDSSPGHRWADRLLLRHVDYYFAVSEPLARYASEWLRIPAGRHEKLLNGVDTAPRSSGATPPFTIVQLARVEPQKNQMMALAVAARLRAVVPVFRWQLVGRTSSAYAGECRRVAASTQLRDQVHFLGERSDTAALLHRAHVGVLTSSAEGLPIALLEYMASGLPVVVTDAGECGRIVRESGGGIVVGSSDVAGFAQALQRLAGDPDRAARMGEAGRLFVRAGYGLETMIRRVEAVYEDLLAGRTVGTRMDSRRMVQHAH